MDFELKRDNLTSLSGRVTGLLPFSCMQNGFVKLNEDALLSNEIADITEEIKSFLILGRSGIGNGECK